MKKNLGYFDRILRLFFVTVIIALYTFEMISGVNPTLMMAIAVAFMLSSTFSFSPIYLTFGVSTRK